MESRNSNQYIISKPQIPSSNKAPTSKNKKPYDLEERTANFGEQIIDFVQKMPKTVITIPLISQLIRAATSVGANYLEADASSTKKDFRFKISLCRKEAKETRHWLRMMVKAVPASQESARELWQEAQELTFIFSSILK